jgi:hypothetical protein
MSGTSRVVVYFRKNKRDEKKTFGNGKGIRALSMMRTMSYVIEDCSH